MITSEFQKKIRGIAAALDADWMANDYQDEIFAELAESTLKKFDHSGLPSLSQMHEELHTLTLPEQTFPRLDFSDFPVTLARTDLFSIDLYYWYTMDTGIHDHHFHGAFKVVEGGSLDVHYQFQTEEVFGRHLASGTLEKVSMNHQKKGDVQKINRYEKFIHQVFHLRFPTITLCIRTNKNHSLKPLSTYLYPNYRVAIHELEPHKLKWLLGLNHRLELNEPIGTVALTFDEVFYILYRHINQKLILAPKVIKFLEEYMQTHYPNINVAEICKRSEVASLKLKKIFVISEVEKMNQERDE